jgi:hypothetical protein
MLEELKWPTLEERRQRARLVLMYKIVNGLVEIDATDRLVQPSRLMANLVQEVSVCIFLDLGFNFHLEFPQYKFTEDCRNSFQLLHQQVKLFFIV